MNLKKDIAIAKLKYKSNSISTKFLLNITYMSHLTTEEINKYVILNELTLNNYIRIDYIDLVTQIKIKDSNYIELYREHKSKSMKFIYLYKKCRRQIFF